MDPLGSEKREKIDVITSGRFHGYQDLLAIRAVSGNDLQEFAESVGVHRIEA